MLIILTDRDNKLNTVTFFDAVALNTSGIKTRSISILDNDSEYYQYDLNEWNITVIN